jgi:hypothetical protein
MKRRRFAKTKGSAAGGVASGACSTTRGAIGGKRAGKKHSQTTTYALAPISPPERDGPFTLSVRQPGWFPDGADLVRGPRQRLYQAEASGKTARGKYESFPIHFLDKDEGSKKWVLGSKLIKTEEAPPGKVSLTRFVRRLALRARQYNASLYRLRRLHFFWDYRHKPDQVNLPPPNPYGSKPGTPDPSDAAAFGKMVKAAEKDWSKVANQMNDLLDDARANTNPYGLTLVVADMTSANGYIVSMRVVVQTQAAEKQSTRTVSGWVGIREPGGSSSHVSISSPFSSSSPNPSASSAG